MSLIEDLGDKLPEDDRKEITQRIEAVREALNGTDAGVIDSTKQQLAEVLQRVGTKAYETAGSAGPTDGPMGPMVPGRPVRLPRTRARRSRASTRWGEVTGGSADAPATGSSRPMALARKAHSSRRFRDTRSVHRSGGSHPQEGPEMDRPLGQPTEGWAGEELPDQAATPEPSPGARGPRIGRRSLLRMMGLSALAIAPMPVLPELLRTAASAGPAEPIRGPREPARTRDGRIRQWTMIIDLRSCDGCQGVGGPPRCTSACIEGHLAPEPMEWIQVYEEELPGGGTRFVPAPCQQCQNPPCNNVCPVGATFSTPEGTVLIDQDRCIGCRICMAACPYDRRFFNWGEPPIPPEARLADYSPEHQVPARKGTVMKCDFCPDMARAGTLPYCVQGCPNRAIYYGDLEEDIATNGRVVVSASRFLAENNAFRLKEELGTQPRVYYIPGHGEAVGRDAFSRGRAPTEWPWTEVVEGAVTWSR